MLRFVLLALLADDEPKHGYALMKAFAERSGVRLSIGNVYRELQRLMAEGFIVTAANPIGADPRRAPYSITEAGRDALQAWLTMPARTLAHGGLDPLAYRLALLADVDPAQADAFLEDLQNELWSRAKAIESARGSDAHDEHGVFSTRAFLQSRHARYLAADIELIAELRTALSDWRKRMPASRPSVVERPVLRRAFRRSDAKEDAL